MSVIALPAAKPRRAYLPCDVIAARVASAVFTRSFDTSHEVETFLARRGFSCAPWSRQGFRGVMFGHGWQIPKWEDLAPRALSELHGVVVHRDGTIDAVVFFEAPAFAIAAVAEPHLCDRIISTWANQQ
jgi:hypothetical protein